MASSSSSRRSSGRRGLDNASNDDNDGSDVVENNDEGDREGAVVASNSMRSRNRAVAQREASRLARPERRKIGKLRHATRSKSAVSSTPSGYHHHEHNNDDDDDDDKQEEPQEWCGPFSVARQVRVCLVVCVDSSLAKTLL